jgi:hypothetical protein
LSWTGCGCHPAQSEQQGPIIQQALQARSLDGRLLFDSVQATWNLLEQSAGAQANIAAVTVK